MDLTSHLWTMLQEASSQLYAETGDLRLLGLQDVAMGVRFEDDKRLGRGLMTITTRTRIAQVVVNVTVETPTPTTTATANAT
jgi:hypothetical protein